MKSLFLFNEAFTLGFNFDMLNVVFVGSILCGIGVITTKNPILSVLYLIGLFLNVAVYLMTVGIHFIGLSYLLVYVGAVSILFLFILMLINVRISELVTDNNNSVFLGLIIGIFFSIIFYNLLPSNNIINLNSNQNSLDQVYSPVYSPNYINNLIEKLGSFVTNSKDTYRAGDTDLYFVSSHIWDGALAETSHITSIGNVIYTVYPMWLILTSIILLLAMVGAIVITIKQK